MRVEDMPGCPSHPTTDTAAYKANLSKGLFNTNIGDLWSSSCFGKPIKVGTNADQIEMFEPTSATCNQNAEEIGDVLAYRMLTNRKRGRDAPWACLVLGTSLASIREINIQTARCLPNNLPDSTIAYIAAFRLETGRLAE